MANEFRFKQFVVEHDANVMKVGTDGVLLGAFVNPKFAKNILDIGTGTGLIALMLAQKSNAQITAIDINDSACQLALRNVSNSPWAKKINVINSSIQDVKFISEIDLIVSNPPFYSTDVHAPEKARAVSRHTIELEPEDIVVFAKKFLSENGRCYVIYPVDMADKFINLAEANGFYVIDMLKVKSFKNSQVIRKIVGISNQRDEFHERTISIENEIRHDYSEDYKSLTCEYYLKF